MNEFFMLVYTSAILSLNMVTFYIGCKVIYKSVEYRILWKPVLMAYASIVVAMCATISVLKGFVF